MSILLPAAWHGTEDARDLGTLKRIADSPISNRKCWLSIIIPLNPKPPFFQPEPNLHPLQSVWPLI